VLRRTLASAIPPCLVLDSDAVALDVDAVDVDVVDFGRLVRVHDREALAKAVELYRGDLLEGFAFRGALFEEWLIAERERLREIDRRPGEASRPSALRRGFRRGRADGTAACGPRPAAGISAPHGDVLRDGDDLLAGEDIDEAQIASEHEGRPRGRK
jgi:hypothetical protein